MPLSNPYALSLAAVALSNMVSNVPATVLLAPHMPLGSPIPWYVLSLATTYAGNLFTIGSMANLIVIEQARLEGVKISFREYALSGIPVTAMNLLVLAVWIALRADDPREIRRASTRGIRDSNRESSPPPPALSPSFLR